MSRYSQNAKDRHLTTHAHVLTKIDMTQPTRNLSCNNFPDTSHIYCQTFLRCHGNEGTLKSIYMLVAKYTCTTQERRLTDHNMLNCHYQHISMIFINNFNSFSIPKGHGCGDRLCKLGDMPANGQVHTHPRTVTVYSYITFYNIPLSIPIWQGSVVRDCL